MIQISWRCITETKWKCSIKCKKYLKMRTKMKQARSVIQAIQLIEQMDDLKVWTGFKWLKSWNLGWKCPAMNQTHWQMDKRNPPHGTKGRAHTFQSSKDIIHTQFTRKLCPNIIAGCSKEKERPISVNRGGKVSHTSSGDGVSSGHVSIRKWPLTSW